MMVGDCWGRGVYLWGGGARKPRRDWRRNRVETGDDV